MHKNQQLTSVQLLAEAYLKEIGFLNISNQSTVLTMEKDFIVNTKFINIIVRIENIFPLKYPNFYVKNDSMFLIYPHIEQKNTNVGAHRICLFDESDKYYYENVELLLNDSINKLEEFLEDIFNEKYSKDEIFEEFDSYWDTSELVLNYNKDFIKQYKGLKLLDIYVSKSNQNLMLVDDTEKLDNFFDATKIQYEKSKIIYLDFKDIFPSKIPSNYKEFLNAIQNTEYYDEFRKFKTHHNLFNGILFSFILPNGNEHFSFLYITPTMKKEGKKVKLINPLVDLLSPLRLNRKLEGGSAKDISSKRIYTRGGNEINEAVNHKNKKIAIVGCGSIGASLAYKLLKVGCTNLVLIDSDRLSVDNISRHLLGMEYININKADALKSFLLKQFIGNKVIAIPDSAVNCFDELKECDLIVSALGSDAKIAETKMIHDAIIGELPSVISCWVEANAIAGHSILFSKNSIDKKLNISNTLQEVFERIIILKKEYGKNLQKNDVGCNSSYMPYSFLNSDMHVNHFTNMIVQYILDNKIKPIFSSIGDLSAVKEHLKDEYEDFNSFTLLKKEIIE